MKPPEGAIITAIWRCKRGHESPAKWVNAEMPIYLESGQVAVHVSNIQFTMEDGVPHDICMRCIIEDYGTQCVEFKEG